MNALDVLEEADRAERRYGPFTSTHEGYGVLAEEMAELLDAIRANDGTAVEREALQVAAVAFRIGRCCANPEFRERSNLTPAPLPPVG